MVFLKVGKEVLKFSTYHPQKKKLNPKNPKSKSQTLKTLNPKAKP